MTRGLSIYLDFLRLVAALEVFVFHLAGLPQTGLPRALWNAFGHEAVTIFFVLSGFVIRYAASTRDHTLEAFAVSRMTRVYSVVIPCLLLTWLFDRIGQSLDPAVYTGLATDGSALVRLAIGAAMLNEAWFSVQMFSNTPYWSISYEWWYYVVFAAAFYLRGKVRVAAVLLVAAIAGPKILLLWPIWLMGWAAYRETASARWPRAILWLCFLQPIAVVVLYCHYQWQPLSGSWLKEWIGQDMWRNGLVWSRYMISDTLLGLSVALHLVAAKRLSGMLAPLLRLERPIRWAAGRSFTLYLLHQPAILFVTACLGTALSGAIRPLVIGALALAIVAAVAAVTEGQRRRLKPPIEWLVRQIGSARRLSTPTGAA